MTYSPTFLVALQIDGLVLERCNSIANALDLRFLALTMEMSAQDSVVDSDDR